MALWGWKYVWVLKGVKVDTSDIWARLGDQFTFIMIGLKFYDFFFVRPRN